MLVLVNANACHGLIFQNPPLWVMELDPPSFALSKMVKYAQNRALAAKLKLF